MTQNLATLDLSDYYQPHSGQQVIHDSTALIKVLEIGRRFGKSRAAYGEAVKCFVEALQIPAPDTLIPPWHGWALSPTFPQSRQIWNEAMTLWPRSFVADISQDERTIYLKGTDNRPYGILEFKSAHDPDSLQTVGLDFLWIQEAQDVSNAAFEKVLPTLRSPGRMGRGVFEGIPSAHGGHWFWRVCDAALNGRPGYEYFHATAFDNPLLDEFQKAEIEADRELLPDRAWRRMYLAERSEDSGYFSNIANCVAGDLLSGPLPGGTYVAGLDLGRKMDPSVLTIMDGQDRKVVAHQAWDVGADWILQREGTQRLCQEWGIQRLVIDATGMGGDMFVAEMVGAGLPVEPYIFTAASRENLLQALAIALERQSIHFPSVPSLLRQLRSFQYRKLPGGGFKAEAPPGEHDDEVFALALALTACAPAPEVSANYLPRTYNGRYVPTQEEANNGGLRSKGAQRMHARKIDRVRERQGKLGLV